MQRRTMEDRSRWGGIPFPTVYGFRARGRSREWEFRHRVDKTGSGLKLEKAKVSVQLVVIDWVKKVPTED
jgi:hypothetical protein